MSSKIIDVSTYNGSINFSKVKAAGISGVIIRILGKNGVDSRFTTNVQGAIAAGLPWGVYQYSYAGSVNTAQADAKQVVSLLKGLDTSKMTLGVWFDFEDVSTFYYKSIADNDEIIKAYKRIIEAAGYKFGIYTGAMFYKKCTPSALGSNWWWAGYPSSSSITPSSAVPAMPAKYGAPSDLVAWQYSSTCKVSGISGNVDISVLYKLPGSTAAAAATTSTSWVSKMTTVKYGSSGKAVKVWQAIIGVTVDGSFGNDTRAKTQTWQMQHGLDPDGVVGPLTWKKALPC